MTKKTNHPLKNRPAPKKKAQLTASTIIFIDLLSILFSLMPGVCAISLTGLFIYHYYAATWLVFPLAPFVLLATFIAIIAIIRLSLPRLKQGRYKFELSKTIVAWYCHLALSRAAKITGLIPMLQSFYVTKFLYWRALGANVSFNITNSFDIDLVDTPLITIGQGVTLGSQSSLSCHSHLGNYLILAPVIIEDDAFIAMSCTIGPGTTIKQGAWIGYGNSLINQVVEKNTKMKNIRPAEYLESSFTPE